MVTNMKFSECLKYILSTLDISMNRLSKAINVDSSLVNRWVHGKRIPSLRTSYVESISEYLSKNVQNSFQVQSLNELFLKVCKDKEPLSGGKEKIMKVLLESQGYSIECERKERNEKKTLSINKKHISKILKNDSPVYEVNSDVDENSIQDLYNLTDCIELSREDKVILGNRNVFAASIHLLEEAANQTCSHSSTIYISFNNDTGIANHPPTNLIHWRSLVLKAIENGWSILCLVRLNSNIGKTINFINFAKPLLKTGKFNPYYYKKHDAFSPEKEVISIPGVGALVCLSTKPYSGADCAFYFKNRVAIDVSKDYINLLLSTHSKPLVKYYTQESNDEYSHRMTENEENFGDRFLNKYCFSILTLPEGLYEKLLRKKRMTDNEMSCSLEYYRRRRNAFQLNIQKYEYRDIYFLESINHLLLHRKFYLYCHTGVEVVDLEVQDVIELLQNMIRLLEKHNNYNIAFTPRDTEYMLTSSEFYCFVKERHAVFLEAYEPFNSKPSVRLSTEEPTLVKAFEEYFKEMWEQISPVNKDKKEVIHWMQRQIYVLENSD